MNGRKSRKPGNNWRGLADFLDGAGADFEAAGLVAGFLAGIFLVGIIGGLNSVVVRVKVFPAIDRIAADPNTTNNVFFVHRTKET